MVLWWDPPSSPSMFLRNARASELQLWSLSLLSAAQNSGLSQWYTAPQCLPCCAGLCILLLFFSLSLILFHLAHVSFPFFFSWLVLHLKGPPFTAFSGHPLSLFQSLWGILLKVLNRRLRVTSISTPSAFAPHRDSGCVLSGLSCYKTERWSGPVAFSRPFLEFLFQFVSALSLTDLTKSRHFTEKGEPLKVDLLGVSPPPIFFYSWIIIMPLRHYTAAAQTCFWNLQLIRRKCNKV